LPLIQQYLRDQQDLTAVERFSRRHDTFDHGSTEPRYRELLPATPPGPGQQYAFEVNLDLCSGCKACVTACHSLNGLDPGESWRSVGLLHGGSMDKPVQQTVSTACHHCVDPACLKGCPVDAYEKDPITGIVKHLDDQCIGCKYCTLTCPYEVPQYNAGKGIVRKCDMCSGRLAAGEAPACVQACPNEAIRIQVVDTRQVLENAQSDAFLPGAPSPGITVPTTSYASERVLPKNLLPADFYAVRPAEQHRPLVVMLVLTQLSVGAFCVERLGSAFGTPEVGPASFWHAALSLAIGLLALSASLLHLGRPLYAFRAILGLRHSWLSREIAAFSLFAGFAVLHSFTLGQLTTGLGPVLGAGAAPRLGIAVAASGLLGVFCSVMLYAVTLRRFWSFSHTAFKFFMSTAVLGASAGLCSAICATALGQDASAPLPRSELTALWVALALGMLVKLSGELSVLLHLRDKQQGELKRSALLLAGPLREPLGVRVALGMLGAVVLPWLLTSTLDRQVETFHVVLALGSLAAVLAGELIERALFFSAVSAPRMPGSLR
jgi:Fe-S-cluster-containing dehydrogenase component/DMSO reductase anchor subunit